MSTIDKAESDRWHRASPNLWAARAVIELPGDVWNNNRIFRDGLFTPSIGSIPKTWDMPRTVRAIYDAMPPGMTTFYPEQLDVTFDFVPRMCATKNCHICVFGAGTSRLCHGRAGLYCSVTLAACGYVHSCNPKACSFRSDSVKGICKKALLTTT
jgi:hypothetical protein